MKAGIFWLGVSIFFAGAAFQEAITGTWINEPDGGMRSITMSVFAFLASYVLITGAKRRQR